MDWKTAGKYRHMRAMLLERIVDLTQSNVFNFQKSGRSVELLNTTVHSPQLNEQSAGVRNKI
jgi:hypothetical protein